MLQIASDEGKLQLLRSLYGSTSNLTAMQPIIVVEGSDEQSATRVVPDRKMYRAIHEKFDRVTVISGGGKGECIKLRKRLHEALGEITKSLQVVALLDRDLSEATADEHTHFLPVSMIENLLVDPESIWEAIQSVVEKTRLKTVADVAGALDAILDRLKDAEVERRVFRSLGPAVFRPHAPLAQLDNQVKEFLPTLEARFSITSVQAQVALATKVVTDIINGMKRREFYNGKAVLGQFFKDHLHNTSLSKIVFYFETARYARRRKSVKEFFDTFFAPLLPGEAMPTRE